MHRLEDSRGATVGDDKIPDFGDPAVVEQKQLFRQLVTFGLGKLREETQEPAQQRGSDSGQELLSNDTARLHDDVRRERVEKRLVGPEILPGDDEQVVS